MDDFEEYEATYLIFRFKTYIHVGISEQKEGKSEYPPSSLRSTEINRSVAS